MGPSQSLWPSGAQEGGEERGREEEARGVWDDEALILPLHIAPSRGASKGWVSASASTDTSLGWLTGDMGTPSPGLFDHSPHSPPTGSESIFEVSFPELLFPPPISDSPSRDQGASENLDQGLFSLAFPGALQ